MPRARVRVCVLALCALTVAAGMAGAPAAAGRTRAAANGATVAAGLDLVSHVAFNGGTHFELATIRGRDYAFVNELTDLGGILRVVDVTTPGKARQVAKLACGGNQGYIQISHDKRTLLIGIDSPSSGGCMPADQMGFVTVDITNPLRPRAIGFAVVERGSHSLAAHPQKPYVYSAEGFPEAPGEMQVWSIKDPKRPKLVTTLDTGVHSPHDLSFTKDGKLAATANVVNVHLLDTRDPADPKILFTTQCPGCVHNHEARFTPDGKRLVVNDEYPASPACPGGAMYFYDVVKEASTYSLMLTGAYTPDDIGPNSQGSVVLMCTAHVFDISNDGKRLAASWHEGGVKYLDISRSAGVTVGSQQVVPGGVREIASYTTEGGDAFSAKLFKGPYVYVVDTNLGFQVFRVTSN